MGNELERYITDEELEALMRPTDVARGLPGRAYTDPGFWALECRDYFASRWMACTHASEISEPGDVIPISIGGYELVVTRDLQGAVHAFHNICAHRGMRVVSEKLQGQSRFVALGMPGHTTCTVN